MRWRRIVTALYAVLKVPVPVHALPQIAAAPWTGPQRQRSFAPLLRVELAPVGHDARPGHHRHSPRICTQPQERNPPVDARASAGPIFGRGASSRREYRRVFKALLNGIQASINPHLMRFSCRVNPPGQRSLLTLKAWNTQEPTLTEKEQVGCTGSRFTTAGPGSAGLKAG